MHIAERTGAACLQFRRPITRPRARSKGKNGNDATIVLAFFFFFFSHFRQERASGPQLAQVRVTAGIIIIRHRALAPVDTSRDAGARRFGSA